jgi:trans-aconitate 2-methyltransferase
VTRDWDAATYDRIADPQARWGNEVLDRLPLRGDERVLDAGCGSGRVTERLAERLPNGSVVALDMSPAMLAEARRRLGRFGDRIEFVAADLGAPLPIEPVDAILSTATFHWVPDHDALFRNLAAVLRPGGRVVAQCGGVGNVATFAAVMSDLGLSRPGDVVFATPNETADRLAASGFVDIRTWLTEEPTTFEAGEPFESFLATVCLRPYLDRLPIEERAAFVDEVARRMPGPVLDYVRLNMSAVRG